MDGDIQHQAPLSPIHLVIDLNLITDDITSLQFLVAFLYENAYNIQRRLDVEFQPSIDWMQLPLDVKEEIVNCPPSMHNDDEVAPSFAALDQSTRIKVLPPPTWKHLHPKITKPTSQWPCAKVFKRFHPVPAEECWDMIKISLGGVERLMLNKLTHLLMIFCYRSCFQSTSKSSLQCPSSFL